MSHDSSLEPVLRAVEPAARLVPERHLRQVLHYLIDRGWALPTNSALPFWIPRTELAAADVLPSRVMQGTEPKLLLITDPNDRMMDRRPVAEQLREYWRALFRAAVLKEFDRRWDAGDMNAETATRHANIDLNQFGHAAAREIVFVLEAEHLAAAGWVGASYFRMFAAVYLDLVAFDPHAAEHYFPTLPREEADRALGAIFDVPALLAASRPAGAADPHREPDPVERWAAADTHVAPPPAPPGEAGGLLGQAHEAEQRGNHVRAAVLRTQAAAAATGTEREQAVAGSHAALGKLVDALGDVFGWDHETRQEWRQALTALLPSASAGAWPRAARCLYDLQTIPADLAREVFAVDLVEVIRTLGRRPVKRPLPYARPVLILMRLKKAHAQLLRAGLGHAAQLRLDRLFHHQIHHLEHDIRRDFTPVITEALTSAGLVPENVVEEVARDKVVAELLDRICDRGYLRIGHLRDAIARNRFKMGDLSGPGEFLAGDPLLKADTNLTYALDGVYRRGEFYLRFLQRASSLFFATAVGRFLFLYALLPFTGAFMTVVFAQEMAHLSGKVYELAAKMVARKPAVPPADPANPAPDKVEADETAYDEETGEVVIYEIPEVADLAKQLFTSSGGHGFHVPWWWVGGLTLFLFLCINVPPFRRGVAAGFALLWAGVRGVLWDFPLGVWRSQTVRSVRRSRPVQLLFRHFWSPLLITALVFGVMLLLGVNPRVLLRWGWAIWAGLTIAYNTPWGWVLQDRVAEAVSDWWRVVRVNLIPGMIATILDWFRMLANWVERQLYAVDEKLRFRPGDSQGSLAVKAILGLLWFPIAYVTRFAFYLLIEPQVNPVKHFPVVTVSHKMLLPLVPSFGEVIAAQTGWGEVKANGWAFGIIACIPGVFGFIAWELLANWRLYRANRASRLRPVQLGGHGESMRGLIRPGFHSGTVPKLFRKLRHADPTRAGRLHHELDHAAEAVHRFAERELVRQLDRSPDWGGLQLHVGAVRFGCQRVAVELAAPALGRDAFAVAFENVGGHISAEVERVGWADKLTEPQRSAFVAALRGLLDLAAVERYAGRERVEDGPPAAGFDDLIRRVTWAEWVARWSAPAKT